MIWNQLLSPSGSFILNHDMTDLKIFFSLQRNPFFPKNFLTIGDWTARVSRKNWLFFSLCNIYIFTLNHLVYWYLIEKGEWESNSVVIKRAVKLCIFVRPSVFAPNLYLHGFFHFWLGPVNTNPSTRLKEGLETSKDAKFECDMKPTSKLWGYREK